MKAATAQFFPAKLAAGDRPRTAGARPEPGRAQAGADCPRADRRRSAAGGVRRTHRPLEAQEASLVSSAILRLRDQGIAILYISHYLNEIATLCDRGTVLRNGGSGRLPGPRPAAEYRGADRHDGRPGNRPAVYSAPAPGGRQWGHPAALGAPAERRAAVAGSFFLIFSRAKSSASPACWAPDAMCWSTYSTAYARRNAAPSTSRAGRGAFVRQSRRSRAGMALVPRDRRHQGLILPFTTADNINLASLPETATFGWERRGLAEQKARDWIEQLAIRPGRPGLPVRYA